MKFKLFRGLLSALAILSITNGCSTLPTATTEDRRAMIEAIRTEPLGDYYVGRRYYKQDYKFWGYVRKPRQPWSAAKLVMLNEQQKLAPDRALGRIGSDHSYEYQLFGRFSGDTVYEPASNGFYPEFVLTGYALRSVDPAPIFKSKAYNNPARRIIARPY